MRRHFSQTPKRASGFMFSPLTLSAVPDFERPGQEHRCALYSGGQHAVSRRSVPRNILLRAAVCCDRGRGRALLLLCGGGQPFQAVALCLWSWKSVSVSSNRFLIIVDGSIRARVLLSLRCVQR
jgi:hypothetical protein